MEVITTNSSSVEGSRGARRERSAPRRGRAAPADQAGRPRARRTGAERSPRAGLDDVYLAEMAASTVLSAAQELELAQRIAVAEHGIIDALVASKAGADALRALGEAIAKGEVDARHLLLNPDQDGLDLPAAIARIRGAMSAASSEDADARREAVSVLADARLDPGIVAELLQALETATEGGDATNAAAWVAATRARRELKRAKERLVIGNLRLVLLFARKYLGRGVPLLDLVQEGNLGLMRAVDKFEHRRGFRFSTYAAWWIKQALQRALLDRALRLPVHVADDRRRVGKVRATFSAQHSREPTAEEIANACGLPRERVETILSLPAQPASLDAPVGDGGDAHLIDFLASPRAAPDDAVAQRALGGQLEGMLETLTSREQTVLRMRFGIGHPREHTLEEVGHALALTRERIRQIERNALEKLRVRSEGIGLHSYLET